MALLGISGLTNLGVEFEENYLLLSSYAEFVFIMLMTS